MLFVSWVLVVAVEPRGARLACGLASLVLVRASLTENHLLTSVGLVGVYGVTRGALVAA